VLAPDGTLLRPTLDIGAVDVSAIRDTRDNPLNPIRGGFLSVNVQYAPRFLGSDFDFVRTFGQVSFIHDLNRWLVWAHGYRLGLIHTFQRERLPYDDLFKAGGPTSVRGYELDSLGPLSPVTGEALGGQALAIVNQELRYHHDRTGLGAAVFWDAGNVFARPEDLAFDLHHSLGVGLRYDSFMGLLRFDLAFPIAKRPGDKGYRFSFGLGQAF
jgi:translocation and assembly module TamA